MDSNGQQVEGTQGYYADGAYTAVASSSPSSKSPYGRAFRSDIDMTEDMDPQEAYYESLCARFIILRDQLHVRPPVKAQSDDSTTLAFVSLHEASHDKLRYILLYTTPSMRVLAKLQQESIMRCLQYAEIFLEKKTMQGQESGRNLGAWCWGLLAKCREVGEMTSEDVSVLRDLGKKAVIVGHKVRSQCRREKDKEEDEDEFEVKNEDEDRPSEEEVEEPIKLKEVDDSSADVELAKQNLLQMLHPSARPEQHRGENELAFSATSALDVIITIVGTMYGQRDLLDARAAW